MNRCLHIFFGALLVSVIAGACPRALAQNHPVAAPEFTNLTSSDQSFQVRYPSLLLTCKRRDGENPDIWSPEEACASDIPVCGDSGHSGEVIMCLAYPKGEFKGSELQAAAFSVSRIDDFNTAEQCLKKWARSDTSEIHGEEIGGLKFQVAKAVEAGTSHVTEQAIYRTFHKTACYELDVNLAIALDSAFAVEDAPRKLTAAEREKIKGALMRALEGFRFFK